MTAMELHGIAATANLTTAMAAKQRPVLTKWTASTLAVKLATVMGLHSHGKEVAWTCRA
jgi:hypothetical protein